MYRYYMILSYNISIQIQSKGLPTSARSLFKHALDLARFPWDFPGMFHGN